MSCNKTHFLILELDDYKASISLIDSKLNFKIEFSNFFMHSMDYY